MTIDIETEGLTLELSLLRKEDSERAGGKGSNLGEVVAAGLPVPAGFVVSTRAFRRLLDEGDLRSGIVTAIASLDVDDEIALERVSRELRARVLDAGVPADIERAVASAYERLGGAVAVRSSATAEDSARASFAGMNESFLGVRGTDAVLSAVRRCWASLYGPRVIAYRRNLGLDEARLAIAVVVQQMVDACWAGVMLTEHPAQGSDRIAIEAAPGLGEVVVGGRVTPHSFTVVKDSLEIESSATGCEEFRLVLGPRGVESETIQGETEEFARERVVELARLGRRIERLFGEPQDIEWALDRSGSFWIVQSRPITASSVRGPEKAVRAKELLRGIGSGFGTAAGVPVVLTEYDPDARFERGEVLVARMTTPDWFPLLRKAAAVVTDEGGATSHAAIVARELAIPAVVGTGGATEMLADVAVVTVDGARGVVLEGRVTDSARRTTTPDPAAQPLVTGNRHLGQPVHARARA